MYVGVGVVKNRCMVIAFMKLLGECTDHNMPLAFHSKTLLLYSSHWCTLCVLVYQLPTTLSYPSLLLYMSCSDMALHLLPLSPTNPNLLWRNLPCP